MTLNELYDYADKLGISVFSKHLNVSKGLAIDYKGLQAIAIDTEIIATETEEKRVLSEEIAHLECGLTYSLKQIHSPIYQIIVHKAETQARHKSAQRLVPFDELKIAVEKYYCREVWQIAEYFQVPDKTVEDALEYYTSMDLDIHVNEE